MNTDTANAGDGRRKSVDPDAIRKMVEDGLGPEGNFCVQSMTNEKTDLRHFYTRDPDKVVAFCEKWNVAGRATFFCVGTVEGERHRKEDVVSTSLINVDIDLKDIDLSAEEVVARLLSLRRPPTRIHRSGNGIHAYWALAAPAPPGEPTEAIRKKLTRALGGDQSPTHDAAMMRMPGTYNTKRSDWRLVEVVRDDGSRYAVEDLEEWDPPTLILHKGKAAADPFTALGNLQTAKPPMDVEARLSAMTHKGEGDTAVHPTQLSVTASLMEKGWEEDAIVTKVLDATKAAVGKAPGWNWKKEEQAIRGMCRDWASKKEKEAFDPEATERSGVTREDFYAYKPQHNFIMMLTREAWPAVSVNEALGNGASAWLAKNRSVEQMTWAPGEPEVIKGRLIDNGGWIEREGVACLNLYRPPDNREGDPEQAGPWLDLVRKVFPEEAEEIFDYFAHAVQKPGVKINHAMMLGGVPGIGKDTILEPVKHAIGPWNFTEASPSHLMGRFNGYVKSVVLRVSEAHDLGSEMNRFQFYEHTKTLIAAPPDVLRCDEKHLREHSVLNCCKVVITTNHKTDGVYLPSDDRRHFVAWSEAKKEDFEEGYWRGLWGWYESGGIGHVCAFLRQRGLASFDPKAPPRKTEAFWEIVSANNASENDELADLLDALGNPDAFVIEQLLVGAGNDPIGNWLDDRKNRRAIPHRLSGIGYRQIRNDAAKDGRFVANGKRLVVYARGELPPRDQRAAALRLVEELVRNPPARFPLTTMSA